MNKLFTITLVVYCFISNTYASPTFGKYVHCSSNGSDCTGCGAGATDVSGAQDLFTYSSGNKCLFLDCSVTVDATKLNGWICASCNGVNNSIVPPRKYFQGGTCVASCTPPATATSDQICYSPAVGNAVPCSSNGSGCTGCGAGATDVSGAQALFTQVSGKNCVFADCQATVAATSSSCAASCTAPNVPNTNQICQKPPAVTGNNVACSTNGTDCTGCGANATIQGLFTYVSGNVCKITDCSSTTTSNAANLNGWVCNFCNGQTGSTVPAGSQFSGSTCATSCPSGQTTSASNSFTCTAGSSTNASVVIYLLRKGKFNINIQHMEEIRDHQEEASILVFY
ncbi:hypothetical protein TTHERM_00775870 (macronuclear) [Tetrahymena thermophila SB210]|uniref:Immobilization antigen n=1 Tax=Tetrahymena thermophila (strain SB210) TaxID=312017 RepID=Q23WW9_TETTS|nr:hypothetical protein TTHERM_00775870 [Tetrahymena thermophila SB210]EAS00976.1 hypothetical protein TTHERM_00775870 [Tetrahymena thermophila SB210]|eukprot:XP_001021221.1 hypothetical protein TTHERM_00775870 [Tetrahymena thermophila SB210]